MNNKININYVREYELCEEFIKRCYNGDYGMEKYQKVFDKLLDGQKVHVEINLDDLFNIDGGRQLIERIEGNTLRYTELFARAIDNVLPSPDPRKLTNSGDPASIVIGHRLLKKELLNKDDGAVPADMLRRYTVGINTRAKDKIYPIREVKSNHVGKLVKLRGIITRITDVKPVMSVCSYICDSCGYEIYQEITTSTFMPLGECPSNECKQNNQRGDLFIQTKCSKLTRLQEAKLQELSDQVPIGHIPRTMSIHFYEEMTKKVKPGDLVELSGIFLPKPFAGSFRRVTGLLADTYLYVSKITQLKPKYENMMTISDFDINRMHEMSKDPEIYDKLATAIAPEIYGHLDVKKALLLQLIGGVTKVMPDGMKLRGDINICLMGDPGVAKSQLLKCITKIAPRALYTTGKGSSGVGLTASISKDPITNEMILDGGALVLADNGICCIDEFDKMDENDRTSIHEAMEQQTISISKAGITTSLNTRTSILAAANPVNSSYNVKKSIFANINLPPALLSRFDILFLLLDKSNVDTDSNLADYVLNSHQHGKVEHEISPEFLRTYIAHARTYEPNISSNLIDNLVNAYVSMRSNVNNIYVTPRTLMSVIRLSQALTRLRFSNKILQSDIDEALRLLDVSKAITLPPTSKGTVDPVTAIYELIRSMIKVNNDLLLDEIKSSILSSGYTLVDFEECINLFSDAGIWAISDNSRLVVYG